MLKDKFNECGKYLRGFLSASLCCGLCQGSHPCLVDTFHDYRGRMGLAIFLPVQTLKPITEFPVMCQTLTPVLISSLPFAFSGF